MAQLDIHQIPVLSDNYVYLLRDTQSGETAVVDPAVSEPVFAALAARRWTLTHILNTHHHNDHTGGNLALKRATGAIVVGAKADAARIPGIDIELEEGDRFALGGAIAEVIDIPGHTVGHIAYWFAQDEALFCGDTIFSLGCGRLFEGTPAQMWNSLKKLRALPDAARVYCAHEYTQSNARFAKLIEPDNSALSDRIAEVDRLRSQGLPTVPSRLGEEKRANPFLRADRPELQRAVNLAGTDAEKIFGILRQRKDSF